MIPLNDGAPGRGLAANGEMRQQHVGRPYPSPTCLRMLNRVIRRIHLYLGLGLSPWILMYAVSTIVMNHREHLGGEGPAPSGWSVERELTYPGTFSEGLAPRVVAGEILEAVDLAGAFTASRRRDGVLVIQRNDLLTPRRVTYTPADGRVVIERSEFRTNGMLERFHRRRGYDTGYALDTAWAVTVDLVVLAIVGWVVTGLWMAWQIKPVRRISVVCGVAGAALFAFFLVTI